MLVLGTSGLNSLDVILTWMAEYDSVVLRVQKSQNIDSTPSHFQSMDATGMQ